MVRLPTLDPGPVLERFGPIIDRSTFVWLGNRGGFSGASLWRGRAADGGGLCLRAWPEHIAAEHLQFVHQLMNDASFQFVPRVLARPCGESILSHQGRLWDVTEWLPGGADFHTNPSDDRLRAALTALAQLHDAWRPERPSRAIGCSSVVRRLAAWNDWQRLSESGWRPDFPPGDPVRPWAECAWQTLPPVLAPLRRRLEGWVRRPLPIRPCLRDIWHDHVLFTGDAVTGIVDYGAAGHDCVAVDLARLLGSFLDDDRVRRAKALEWYSLVRRLEPGEAELIDLLDVSGIALGAANWLRWLYHERRYYEDRAAVARRLAALVERLESPNFGGRP